MSLRYINVLCLSFSNYIFIPFLIFHDRQRKYIKRKIMMNGKNKKLFVDNEEVIDNTFI
ncbi:hypothetical protein MtrunA17_Chr2g0314071 [Medicago truncatula]|uniref:Transmembrane protein n=1 Tax=Medicago truncatula TaxID=3880 RepID=A0A396JCI2_MEDTR|nr:hypothetical protein MtrunA17_Chr2g0314071 [Medicago truncatula]